ncbi:MAG: hypothetical protein HY235_01200 [Acidobacteria bacterium]|nr:hypothetical protein [Acidobacteriota bacterium]
MRKSRKKAKESQPKEKILTKSEIIHHLLKRMGGQVTKEDFKVTLSDFVKLVQLQKELEGEQPKEIEVRWVDGTEPDDAGKS